MLNETQKVSPEKTKSAHKLRLFAVIWIVLFIALVVFMIFAPSTKKDTGPYVKLRNAKFAVTVADTTEERIQGLSGSSSLPAMTGMLFDFPESAQQCIWMKEMNYAIDIVWMDSAGRVTDIKEHVSLDTYPKEQFCSSGATTFVLELPAGSIEAHDVGVGDKATIKLPA